MHRPLLALLFAALLAPTLAAADPVQMAEVAPETRQQSRAVPATIEVDRDVRLGASYVVESLTVSVGQRVLLQEHDLEAGWSGRVADREAVRASMAPGERTVVIDAILRGKGTGEFAWLSQHSLEVSSLCEVELLRGTTTRVDVRIVRRAGPFADFHEGIQVECSAAVKLD